MTAEVRQEAKDASQAPSQDSSQPSASKPNFLTLHREDLRHEYFAGHAGAPPFYDAATQAWIVTDPLQCKELIASGKLRPATYSADYHALQARLGIDFSGMGFAFEHIPLCQHGDVHVGSRRRISEFLAVRKAQVQARLPGMVSANLAALASEGEIDVMQNCIVPLVQDMIAATTGIDAAVVAECSTVSAVFDRSIGIAKRRRIEAEIGILRQRISETGETQTEEEVGMRLALLILGRDALTGTLGESLHRVFVDNAGKRLSDISYPELPPETGVPWVERQVLTPFHLAGCDFAKGDRVRVYLQTLSTSKENKTLTGFFGSGPHVCLGRPLSLDVWKEIVAFLSRVPLRVRVDSYSAKTSDYVFTCPQRLDVTVFS